MAAFAPNDPARALEYFSAKMSFTTGPVELSKAMEAGTVRIVDVRTKDAFEREHIPGSINLPESEWSKAGERGLAHDKPNVLLCYSQVCHLAARAAVELARQGFPVMELEGGFDSWKKHNLPTERAGDSSHDQPVERARELLAQTREAQQKVQPEAKAEAAAKPAEEAKAEEAKPSEEGKGDEAKRADEAKPADAAKPADEGTADEAKATKPESADDQAEGVKGDGADQAVEDDEGSARRSGVSLRRSRPGA